MKKKSLINKYLILSILLFVTNIFGAVPQKTILNILHISFHRGCINEIENVSKELGYNLVSWFIPDLPKGYLDPTAKGNALYNITENRANIIWKRHQNFFNKFDVIITSDTTPLSRIFLQNNFQKYLLIWVCNRFDYSDQTSIDDPFPDSNYYNLIRSIPLRPNVRIFSYTPFEHYYAQKYRDVHSWNQTIKPTGKFVQQENYLSAIQPYVNKETSFFVPPYHNDTIYMNLASFLNTIGIPAYTGRYNGADDLKNFKGIIHIPYAWSNFALFENWVNGKIYFIPSQSFLVQLAEINNFFWSPPFDISALNISEWYNPKYKDLFVYFSSWEDLKYKIQTIDYIKYEKRIKTFGLFHQNEMINKWKILLNSLHL